MGQITLSLATDPGNADAFGETLRSCEFTLTDAPHAFWRGRGPGCVVTFYRKGKVVLQGPAAHATAAVLGLDVPEEDDGAPFEAALALHPDPKPAAWIGTDETGKGDYFGPLVVAAVRLERRHVELAAELGAADSKTIRDKRIGEITPDLKKIVRYKMVVIGPEAYNRLYRKMRNLNRLLAWAHARALEDLLEVAPAPYALTDQFGDKRLVERSLQEKGRGIVLDQRPRAESDPAVAIASILARNEFVWRMRALSKEAGFTLPKGGGNPTLSAGRRIVKAFGEDGLGRFAKLHFVNTQKILGSP